MKIHKLIFAAFVLCFCIQVTLSAEDNDSVVACIKSGISLKKRNPEKANGYLLLAARMLANSVNSDEQWNQIYNSALLCFDNDGDKLDFLQTTTGYVADRIANTDNASVYERLWMQQDELKKSAAGISRHYTMSAEEKLAAYVLANKDESATSILKDSQGVLLEIVSQYRNAARFHDDFKNSTKELQKFVTHIDTSLAENIKSLESTTNILMDNLSTKAIFPASEAAKIGDAEALIQNALSMSQNIYQNDLFLSLADVANIPTHSNQENRLNQVVHKLRVLQLSRYNLWALYTIDNAYDNPSWGDCIAEINHNILFPQVTTQYMNLLNDKLKPGAGDVTSKFLAVKRIVVAQKVSITQF